MAVMFKTMIMSFFVAATLLDLIKCLVVKNISLCDLTVDGPGAKRSEPSGLRSLLLPLCKASRRCQHLLWPKRVHYTKQKQYYVML